MAHSQAIIRKEKRGDMNDKDLFGKRIKKRRPQLEILFAKHDKDTLQSRIDRIKYLSRITLDYTGMAGSMESMFTFEEAKACFVNGQFIATILLAQAFIERELQGQMLAKGYPGANRGLKYIVKYCREKDLLPSTLIQKVDQLRNIRNSFAHLKPPMYEFNLHQRIYQSHFKPVGDVLSHDAREALSTMLTALQSKMR